MSKIECDACSTQEIKDYVQNVYNVRETLGRLSKEVLNTKFSSSIFQRGSFTIIMLWTFGHFCATKQNDGRNVKKVECCTHTRALTSTWCMFRVFQNYYVGTFFQVGAQEALVIVKVRVIVTFPLPVWSKVSVLYSKWLFLVEAGGCCVRWGGRGWRSWKIEKSSGINFDAKWHQDNRRRANRRNQRHEVWGKRGFCGIRRWTRFALRSSFEKSGDISRHRSQRNACSKNDSNT